MREHEVKKRWQPQVRAKARRGVRCGVVCGWLGRSCRLASPSARHWRIQLWAVGREMPISAATWATGRPERTRPTSSRLPKTVSRALRWDTKTSVVR